jgi:DNA repair protein RadA
MKDFKLTDLEKVGPTTEKKLNKAGIFSPLDVVIRGVKEFSRVSGLSTDMATKHVIQLKKLLAEDGNDIEVKDIKSLKALRERQVKTKVHVDELDEMTRGGFETQSMYEIYAPEGTGKTQMSMSLAAEALGKGYGVMFIDCEGTFDLERFDEICKSRDVEYDEDKLGYHMYGDEAELTTGIQNMTEELIERDVKYMVVDGLVGLMRLGYEGRGELNERQIELKNILKYLRNLSILLNIGIIITNQVTANPDPFGAPVKPIGGHVLGHYVKYIIGITKGMKNNRTARLVKSPSQANADYPFFLNEEGVSQYETFKERQKAKKMETVAQEDTSALADKSLLLEDDNCKIKVF